MTVLYFDLVAAASTKGSRQSSMAINEKKHVL